jgi:3-methylfumaryl-CoA hydratase
MSALEDWIGRTRAEEAVLDPELARRYAAAMGAPLDVERVFPPLGHWAYFNEAAAPADLGPDGHPRRGGFMPPVELPRRMFAAAEFRFEAPLALGEPAERVSTIADVRRRAGRSGELVLVDVEHRLRQAGDLKLSDTQTIVYREAGAPTPRIAGNGVAGDGEVWRPTPVDLFRYSAATFNGHRIHYDDPYVREVEGYPALVVHGPFTAAKLCALSSLLAGAPLKSFSFRAHAPLFVGQSVLLRIGAEPSSVEAIRCDGERAMTATFSV